MATIYESVREQIDFPDAFLFQDNDGKLYVRTGNSTHSLTDYLFFRKMVSESCKDDITFLLRQADFTFEGWHNAGSHKDEKNRELQKKLEDLIGKMAIANDLQTLNNLHHQISQLIDKMHVGFLHDEGKERLLDFIDRERISDYYREYRTMLSGLNLEKLQSIARTRMVDPRFIKAFVDSIHDQREQKITLEQQAKNIRTRSEHQNADERVKVVDTSTPMPNEDETHIDSEDIGITLIHEDGETETIGVEEIRSIKQALQNERVDLIKRRSEAQKRKDTLLQKKTELEASSEIKGLFEIEYYEVPIYREYPNPVDGDIAGYEEHTRYKNGTDEERRKYQEAMQKLEQELRKVNEEIEVLSENIDSLPSQIAFYEKAERDTLRSMRSQALHAAEARFFGMSKFQQAMAKLSGKKELLRQLQESKQDLSYEETMQEIDSIGGMFR